MKNPRDIILQPVVSEKSYDLIESVNTYTFEVDRRTNKTEIRQAIEQIFGVKVVAVNTINRKGKREAHRLQGRYPLGQQARPGQARRRRVHRHLRGVTPWP